MTLKTHKFNGSDVDIIVKDNLTQAQSIIDGYNKLPTFETKHKLIQFSRDLIIKTISSNGMPFDYCLTKML